MASDILPSWPSERNSISIRNVSFSSYSSSAEEKFISALVDSRRNKVAEDGEIDVFSADKYFSRGTEEKLNATEGTRKQHHHHQCRKDDVEEVVVNQPKTPSNQSELSSWNSRSALLRRMRRTPTRGSGSKGATQGRKLHMPCCLSCCVNSPVDVEEKPIRNRGDKEVTHRSIKTSLEAAEITRMNKLLQENQMHTDPFFYPAASEFEFPARSLTTDAKKIHLENEDREEERKKSLEVFGSSGRDDQGIIERRLNMLSWDAIPNVAAEEINNSASASGPPSESFKDTESDGSSDLFEIECLSCTANPVVLGSRRPSDASATPTTCYAPSEASIEWSVVTASAANFSTLSDSEDQRSVTTSVTRPRLPPRGNSTTKKPGLLSGCKSQKAVRVAEETYRMPNCRDKLERERKQRYSDSFINMPRLQSEAKLGGYGGKQRKEAGVYTPRSSRLSHSSHASELLYIH